jgi:hypothetical protein
MRSSKNEGTPASALAARRSACQCGLDDCANGKREDVVGFFAIETADVFENNERFPANEDAERRYEALEFRSTELFACRLKGTFNPLDAPVAAAGRAGGWLVGFDRQSKYGATKVHGLSGVAVNSTAQLLDTPDGIS